MTTIDHDGLRKIAEEYEQMRIGVYLHPGTVIAMLDLIEHAEARIKAMEE